MWHSSFLRKIMLCGNCCQWHVEGVSDNFVPKGFGYGFAAAVDVKFGVYVPDMASYRIETNVAMPRDHFVAISLYEISKHFFLAVRKMVFEQVGMGSLEGLKHFLRDGRRQGGTAMENILNGF